jgi:putative addiction module killer protein
MAAIEVREYVTEDGRSPFGRWFEKLDAQAATKVTTALERLTQGNVSSVKGVGEGLLECRIDWGPGLEFTLAGTATY